MTFEEKIRFIFDCPYAIKLGSHVMRSDGEWYTGYEWEHVQLPGGQRLKGNSRFLKLDDCVDDCIKYIKSLEKKSE